MRGTLPFIFSRMESLGIIPAHAGNTPAPHGQHNPRRDHPRTCGEHFIAFRFDVPSRGSSPHMRGTPFAQASQYNYLGIIPAHAGNTFCWDEMLETTKDHPRTCGEHKRPRNALQMKKGSSPHMRGTQSVRKIIQRGAGIIPAHAGNTYHAPKAWNFLRDHPRTCGEHHRLPPNPEALRGSSPHMRGTQLR